MPPIDVTAVTLSELRYVAALAEHRHFGRAAAACHVTQPTLSAQIQKTERTLDVQLFERTSRSVHPTAVGLEVAQAARAVLEGMERIVDVAGRGREPLSGPLRVGMIPTLGPYLLPHVAPLLKAEFPRLRLVFRELKTADLVDEIAKHQIDLGLLALPVPAGSSTVAPLFQEPFWVVLPVHHRLARERAIAEGDLAGEPMLLLDEGHCLREQALSICRGAGAATEAAADFRATSIETLRHMVAAGMGLTLVPALALEERPNPLLAVRPFAPPAPHRRIALVWRKSHPRARDHQLLSQFLRRNLPPGVSPLTRT